MIRRAAAAAVLFVFCSLPGFAGGSQEPEHPGSISVSGEGIVHLTPDIATLNIAVETEDPEANAAVQENARRMQAVFRELGELGISEDSIQTVSYNVAIQRPFQREGQPPQEPFYRVTNTLLVTLEETSLVGSVIDAAFSAGADSVRNIQFLVSSTAEAELKALELAMEHARSKAERMADSQGVHIGPPMWINEEYGWNMPRQESDMMVMSARSADAAPTPVSAGDYSVRARVQVSYGIKK